MPLDWVNYGKHAYGEKYTAALDATGYAYKSLKQYAWIARSVTRSMRIDLLTFASSQIPLQPHPVVLQPHPVVLAAEPGLDRFA